MKHKLPSQRQLRMGEQVRHALSETLQRGKFHGLHLMANAPLLSINEVRMTGDLKNAKAFVSCLNKDQGLDVILEELNAVAPLFQSDLNRKLDAKFTPKVKFVEDQTQEEVNRLEALFHNLPKAED